MVAPKFSLWLRPCNVFIGFFSEILKFGIFAKYWVLKEKQTAAVENVEKCSQINNNSNQKYQFLSFLKKSDIKNVFGRNHQAKNFHLNSGSRKKENRVLIGSSVKDFGSFCQKHLEKSYVKTPHNQSVTSLPCSPKTMFLGSPVILSIYYVI